MGKNSRIEFSIGVLQGCKRTASPLLPTHQNRVPLHRHEVQRRGAGTAGAALGGAGKGKTHPRPLSGRRGGNGTDDADAAETGAEAGRPDHRRGAADDERGGETVRKLRPETQDGVYHRGSAPLCYFRCHFVTSSISRVRSTMSIVLSSLRSPTAVGIVSLPSTTSVSSSTSRRSTLPSPLMSPRRAPPLSLK